MNILYLHGLDSTLKPEKRQILEKHGTVHAPDLDYYADPRAIASILKSFSTTDIDVVIGSSMGGFAGYYVSNALSRPALLFNPALKRRSVPQEIPDITVSAGNLKQIVIGQQDEVVDPIDTLQFLSQHLDGQTDLRLHLDPRLKHQIPVEVFQREVEEFFKIVVRME